MQRPFLEITYRSLTFRSVSYRVRRSTGRRMDTAMTPPLTDANVDTGQQPLGRRDLVVLLVAAASIQAITWTLLLALFSAGRMGYGLHQLADTLLYQQYAVAFSFGQWPYSNVPVEYPPLANLVFLLAPARAGVAAYEAWFSVAMMVATAGAAVMSTAAAALSWRSTTRGLITAVAYGVLTLCCGALALNRYDAVVALALAAALLFIALRRWVPASVSLGIGFALKLTPALLLPVVLVLQESRRRVLITLAAFLITAAVPFIPFAVHDVGTVGYPFTYHAQRPLQIESVPGTLWAAGALLGAAHPHVIHAFGSQDFAGAGPDAMAKASPWLLALAAGAVYAIAWRRRQVLRASLAQVPVAVLAVLLVAICTSKVLSPQFLIWSFPVVALCAAQPRWLPRLSALAVAVAVCLTQVEFPARYWDLVGLETAPLAILVARNAALVTAAVLAVAALVRLRPEADPPAAHFQVVKGVRNT